MTRHTEFNLLWHELGSLPLSSDLLSKINLFCSYASGSLESCLLLAELRRRQGANAEALQIAQQINLDALQAPETSPDKELFAKYYYCLGLLRREASCFFDAADAFLSGLEACSAFVQNLFALQYTRLGRKEISRLIGRLEQIVMSSNPGPVLAHQLYADWAFELGQEEDALVHAYRAAQKSAFPGCSAPLDYLSLPSFPEALIIGAPKCGTTSMAAWLSAHPQIYVHPRKELHFFDARWERGGNWYRCQFPSFRPQYAPILRMEATPNYLQLPEVPSRVASVMPKVKIIILLRNPVERALSWCHHVIRQDGVSGDPCRIIENELDDLESMASSELAGIGWHRTNCVAGSLYHLQLARWLKLFSRDQVLVLQMENLLEHPRFAWQKVVNFLELEPCLAMPPSLPRLNSAPVAYESLDSVLISRLSCYLGDSIALWKECAKDAT